METWIEKRETLPTNSLKCFGDSVKMTKEEMLAIFGKPQTNNSFANYYPLQYAEEWEDDSTIALAPFELKIAKYRQGLLVIFTTTSEYSWRVRETIINMVKKYRESKITSLFN